jgi:hypothetical protein
MEKKKWNKIGEKIEICSSKYPQKKIVGSHNLKNIHVPIA